MSSSGYAHTQPFCDVVSCVRPADQLWVVLVQMKPSESIASRVTWDSGQPPFEKGFLHSVVKDLSGWIRANASVSLHCLGRMWKISPWFRVALLEERARAAICISVYELEQLHQLQKKMRAAARSRTLCSVEGANLEFHRVKKQGSKIAKICEDFWSAICLSASSNDRRMACRA